MRNILKKVGAIVLAGAIVLGSSDYAMAAAAATKQAYKANGNGYDVYTLTVTTGPSNKFVKIDTLGVNKRSYTSGNITVLKWKQELDYVLHRCLQHFR